MKVKGKVVGPPRQNLWWAIPLEHAGVARKAYNIAPIGAHACEHYILVYGVQLISKNNSISFFQANRI